MKILCTILLACAFTFSFAQSISPEVIASSGQHFSNANAQLSWTVGELMIETVSSSGNIVTQGFHQPDEDAGPPDAVEENNSGSVQMNLFPNPAQDKLVIEAKNNEEPLQLQLHDASGKLVLTDNLKENQSRTELDISHFANGTYLLNVQSEDKKYFTTYKIQKTQ